MYTSKNKGKILNDGHITYTSTRTYIYNKKIAIFHSFHVCHTAIVHNLLHIYAHVHGDMDTSTHTHTHNACTYNKNADMMGIMICRQLNRQRHNGSNADPLLTQYQYVTLCGGIGLRNKIINQILKK